MTVTVNVWVNNRNEQFRTKCGSHKEARLWIQQKEREFKGYEVTSYILYV